MKRLRNHPNEIDYRPDRSLTKWGICMHQGFGPFRISQSVGSLVSEINSDVNNYKYRLSDELFSFLNL